MSLDDLLPDPPKASLADAASDATPSDAAPAASPTGEVSEPVRRATPPPLPPSYPGDGDAVVTRGLTKLFRGVAAVDGLDLCVKRGRFFGFLGPNGAGKSTTLKMLTGLMRPTRGEVFIEGLPLGARLIDVKRQIGIVPEELALYERLTGEEYLQFAGRMYGLPRTQARQRTGELLEFLSLQDERRKLIVDYSQGMRKKLALAAALIHNPRVLFLDEPLNGIDPVAGRVVSDLLRRLAAKGVTLFFTSHVLDVVERLCDEVAVIDRGRLIVQGTLDQIRAQREVAGDASLEDVFLKLVAADVERADLSWIG